MVRLVVRAKTFQYFQCFLLRRFLHLNGLESSLERSIFFNILSVLVDRSRADHLNFSAGQGGFQDVGSIKRSLRAACTDHSMQLIDEKNNIGALGYFFYDILYPLLKLTAIFSPGYHAGHIKHYKAFVPHLLRYDPPRYALGKPLHDSSLSDSRLSDQAGIILSPSAQDLHDTSDFRLSPYDRIKKSLLSLACEVTTIFFK